jgi:regulator of protease activity HflC (stomatin/prohibitin superfamily)
VKVTLVEVKDVELPETMRRAMASQAEAERDRRAKVIHAPGEREAARTLGEAAVVLEAGRPGGDAAAGAVDHGRGVGRAELHPDLPATGQAAAPGRHPARQRPDPPGRGRAAPGHAGSDGR